MNVASGVMLKGVSVWKQRDSGAAVDGSTLEACVRWDNTGQGVGAHAELTGLVGVVTGLGITFSFRLRVRGGG